MIPLLFFLYDLVLPYFIIKKRKKPAEQLVLITRASAWELGPKQASYKTARSQKMSVVSMQHGAQCCKHHMGTDISAQTKMCQHLRQFWVATPSEYSLSESKPPHMMDAFLRAVLCHFTQAQVS